MATEGLADFVESSLRGIRGCGIDPAMVHVVVSEAAGALRRQIQQLGGTPRIAETLVDRRDAALMTKGYVNYGTPEFNRLMKLRFRIVSAMLDEGRQIISADVDVAWMRNPLPYLSEVLRQFPWAGQTEAEAKFPPNFCLGFFALRDDPRCRKLIEEHIAYFDAAPDGVTMQGLFNQIVSDDPSVLEWIFPLPEGLFPNGLLQPLLTAEHSGRLDYVVGRVQPFIFHGNFTVGLEDKRRLLRHARAWWTLAEHEASQRKDRSVGQAGFRHAGEPRETCTER